MRAGKNGVAIWRSPMRSGTIGRSSGDRSRDNSAGGTSDQSWERKVDIVKENQGITTIPSGPSAEEEAVGPYAMAQEGRG
ncbi:hypothetical protein NDU88_002396 [Pleurodeles waltl]|uniref:Uncharacterized protein n=1 Tax=Pleurodeles waltl TaxID=8319 RepID=A0AAV7MSM7_PLEWA|nr:hypothetical protein NDU88_002396 [Pleurodeles waltl]